MLTFLARRLLVMIPTLFMISVLVFIVIQLPPGDFLTTYMNELKAQGEAVLSGQFPDWYLFRDPAI